MPTPIPATVWTPDEIDVDPDAAWPPPIVRQIVTAFSRPGNLVGLLCWPSNGGHRNLRAAAADRATGDRASTEFARELASAVSIIEELERTGQVLRIASDPATWTPNAGRARVVPDGLDRVAQLPTLTDDRESLSASASDSVAADADLIVTSMAPPTDKEDQMVWDLVAQSAARTLRVGGTLVVLTHCDWSHGRLVDPTGAMVASAQNADLLYLQHIVAVHAPVRDGVIAPARCHSAATGPCRSPAGRAGCRPHRRIHSDVLVFTQPHDYQPPQPPPSQLVNQAVNEAVDEIGGRS